MPAAVVRAFKNNSFDVLLQWRGLCCICRLAAERDGKPLPTEVPKRAPAPAARQLEGFGSSGGGGYSSDRLQGYGSSGVSSLPCLSTYPHLFNAAAAVLLLPSPRRLK